MGTYELSAPFNKAALQNEVGVRRRYDLALEIATPDSATASAFGTLLVSSSHAGLLYLSSGFEERADAARKAATIPDAFAVLRLNDHQKGMVGLEMAGLVIGSTLIALSRMRKTSKDDINIYTNSYNGALEGTVFPQLRVSRSLSAKPLTDEEVLLLEESARNNSFAHILQLVFDEKRNALEDGNAAFRRFSRVVLSTVPQVSKQDVRSGIRWYETAAKEFREFAGKSDYEERIQEALSPKRG